MPEAGPAVLTRIANGRVIDPAHGRDGVGDVWMRDGRIVDAPTGARADESHDATGRIVMAGAIDIHSHIAGANTNTARLLLPEQHRAARAAPGRDAARRPPAGRPSRPVARYAEMGFTTVVEPAVAPHHALHAHLELADTPIIDKAILAVLGNDDFLLGLMRAKEGAARSATTSPGHCEPSRALGIKVINAGGAAAFKANVRAFSLDDVVPWYGVTSRAIVKALQHAVHELGVPHPLHVHCNNLGMAGNAETALATIAAAEGLPLHLAHLQFYGYGKEGERGFSSAAARIAEAVNAAQERHHRCRAGDVRPDRHDLVRRAAPVQRAPSGAAAQMGRSSTAIRNGGGIVPYNYRADDFYNAVQWAIGLELFLLIDDPCARVLHHRSSERRAVHDLSGDLRTADEPRPARRMDLPAAAGRNGGHDAAVDHARIFARRDRR